MPSERKPKFKVGQEVIIKETGERVRWATATDITVTCEPDALTVYA